MKWYSVSVLSHRHTKGDRGPGLVGPNTVVPRWTTPTGTSAVRRGGPIWNDSQWSRGFMGEGDARAGQARIPLRILIFLPPPSQPPTLTGLPRQLREKTQRRGNLVAGGPDSSSVGGAAAAASHFITPPWRPPHCLLRGAHQDGAIPIHIDSQDQ
ncbi:hypothetical protein LZ30DRAFT_743451 [Colletotrichum cereale]|nr:hypothetical protein LZ30DRAFT_743451 [Colletotrichum cereale]